MNGKAKHKVFLSETHVPTERERENLHVACMLFCLIYIPPISFEYTEKKKQWIFNWRQKKKILYSPDDPFYSRIQNNAPCRYAGKARKYVYAAVLPPLQKGHKAKTKTRKNAKPQWKRLCECKINRRQEERKGKKNKRRRRRKIYPQPNPFIEKTKPILHNTIILPQQTDHTPPPS
jgi:hypothetical protein